MNDIIGSGDADFLAMARPFIREPDLGNKLAAGRTGMVECVSCNMCLAHDGYDALQYWRKSPRSVARPLAAHHWRTGEDADAVEGGLAPQARLEPVSSRAVQARA